MNPIWVSKHRRPARVSGAGSPGGAGRRTGANYASFSSRRRDVGGVHYGSAILAFGGNSRAFLSLAGISFPNSKFKWHTIALSGWKSAQGAYGTGDPAYGVVGPIVYLGGSIATTTGSIIFAATPASVRPRHELNIEVYTSGATYGQIQVTKPSLYVESVPASNAQLFTSLAGVSYPLSS